MKKDIKKDIKKALGGLVAKLGFGVSESPPEEFVPPEKPEARGNTQGGKPKVSVKEEIQLPSQEAIEQIQKDVAGLRTTRETGLTNKEELRLGRNLEGKGDDSKSSKMSVVEDGQWNKLDDVIKNIMALPDRKAFTLEINEKMDEQAIEKVETNIESTEKLVKGYKKDIVALQQELGKVSSGVKEPLTQLSTMLDKFTAKLEERGDKVTGIRMAQENPQQEERKNVGKDQTFNSTEKGRDRSNTRIRPTEVSEPGVKRFKE